MKKLSLSSMQARRVLWIKGAKTPGGAVVPFDTENEAKAFRLAMYRAGAKVRRNPEEDAEFALAMSQVMLQVLPNPEGGWNFHVGAGVADAKLLKILEDLGVTEEELAPPIEKAIAASLKALDEKATDPFAGENPYFKR